jgi:FkbM family methyltransferase
MARATYLAGRTLDRIMSWTEAAAPDLAQRFKRRFYRPDMAASLDLLRKSGLQARAVIDVGAYLGNWAKECRGVFPDARILMVEPWPERVEKLHAMRARDPLLAVEQALLSSSEGAAEFAENESNSGIVQAGTGRTVRLPTKTLDGLVAGTPFERAELLKVDVQGHDLDVLKGGERTLSSARALIVELSLIRLHSNAPELRTAIDWLDDRGFRLFDIAGFIRRPVDDALWQLDAVFVPSSSPLGRVEAGW